MSKSKSKFMSILVVLTLVITLFLTACGSNDGSTNQTDQSVDSANNNSETADNNDNQDESSGDDIEGFSYPLEGNRTLTYWADFNSNVAANYANLGDTPLFQELFERTGITVQFQHPAAGQAQEQ